MSTPSPAVSTTFAALTGATGMDGDTVELALRIDADADADAAADLGALTSALTEVGAAPDPAVGSPDVDVDAVATSVLAATATDAPTLTLPPAPPGVTVRRGGLVDVNAAVRLLRASSLDVDIDGDGQVDGPVDPEAARSAARMALSHVVLDSGDLWVAHDDAGELLAISVWMPGAVDGAADDLHRILERELGIPDPSQAIGPAHHVRPQLLASMAGVMEHVLALQPRLVLFAVTVAPLSDPASVVALARAVVAPVIGGDGDVLAVALDGDRARLLRAVGFAEVAQVPLGELNNVWIGRA